jgi:TRAP-type mannitol/chloroaromatic compound transport system permease small subunit
MAPVDPAGEESCAGRRRRFLRPGFPASLAVGVTSATYRPGAWQGDHRMQLALQLSRAIDRLNAGFAVVADYLVLFAVLISAGNATVRYLLDISSNAFLEIQWYMFAAMVMLGASYTLKMNEHVRVDLVFGSLSERGRLWVDVVGITLFLLPVMSVLAWLSLPVFLNSWRSGEMSMNAGGLILWPAKLMLPLGFSLIVLQGLSELVKRIAALTGQIHLEIKYEKPLQ